MQFKTKKKTKRGFLLSYLRQTVQLHGALHSHVPAKVGELHLDQLAWVQRAMPVPARGSLMSNVSADGKAA